MPNNTFPWTGESLIEKEQNQEVIKYAQVQISVSKLCQEIKDKRKLTKRSKMESRFYPTKATYRRDETWF